MKSFFSRRQDSTPTGHSKSASKESYKFWNPNSNPQEDASKPRPLHGNEPPQYITTQSQHRSSTRPIKTPTYHGTPANTYGEGPSTEQAQYPTFRPSASMTAPQNDRAQLFVSSKATSTRYGQYPDKPQPPQPPVTGTPSYTNTTSKTHTPNDAPVKSSRTTSKNDPSSFSTPHEVRIPSHAPSTSRQPLDDGDPSRALNSQPMHQVRPVERTAAVEINRRDREQDRMRDNNIERVRDIEKERTRRRPQDRDVDQDKERRRLEQERQRNLEREKDRAKDTRRDIDRTKERERDREYRREEYARDLARRENDRTKEREKEREREREKEREELERARQIEREKETAREAEKAKEKDRREREKERERRRERERERERERVARDQERAKEAERLREGERVKEAERLKETERLKEVERVKEAERLKEAERMREAERAKEAERVKEAEREQELKDREQERARAREAERLHRERLREADKERERERQREVERVTKDQERAKEAEREQDLKDREQEKARAREAERADRERLREMDKERERARERYYERERKARESDADKSRLKTGDRDRDRRKERDIHDRVVGNPPTRPQGQIQGPAPDEKHGAVVAVEPPRAESRAQDHQLRRERNPRPKEPHRTRDRDRDAPRYRAEATDGEQEFRKAQDIDADRARRKEVRQNGWVSDNYTSRDRKYTRSTPQSGVKEEKEGSDGSARKKKVPQTVPAPTQMDSIAVDKALPLRAEQQVAQISVPPSVPPVSNSFPLVPPTHRQQIRTHPTLYEPKAWDYPVGEAPSVMPPAALSQRTQMPAYASFNEVKTRDQIPPQTSGPASSVAMLSMAPPVPRPQIRAQQPPANTELTTSGYTERQASEAPPSSTIQPMIVQIVPPTPRPQMRTYQPATEPSSGDKTTSRGSEALPSYSIPQNIPPTPRVQTRTFPPTEFKTSSTLFQPSDASSPANAPAALPAPIVQPRTIPLTAEQKGAEGVLPSRLPVIGLPALDAASSQEQSELPHRREINRLKIHPRPADQVSQAPPTQAVDLEPSQSLHPSLASSRTNSNQYHAPAQLYPTASLQRGSSSLRSSSFSQLQAAPAGQPTAVFLPANTVHIANNYQALPEQQNPTLSTSQPPGQEPLADPVASQPSHNAYPTKSQPAILLQSNLAIQLQASPQSNNMSQPNHARKVEVSSIDQDHPSSHHPTVVERTTAPSNSVDYPGDAIVTADVHIGLAKAIVQEPMSSRQPGDIDAVSLPPVHHRDATSRPTDLIARLPETVSGPATFDLPHRSQIDVVPNDVVVSLLNVDEPKPVGDMHSAAFGTPIRSATFTPADKQGVTSVPVLLQPMETPFEGPSVPQNLAERRVQPLIDGGRRTQPELNSQSQPLRLVQHITSSVDPPIGAQTRPVLQHVENILHSASKMATPKNHDHTVGWSLIIGKEPAQPIGSNAKAEDHSPILRLAPNAVQVTPSQQDVVEKSIPPSRQAAFKSSPRHSPKTPIGHPSHALEPENPTPPSISRSGTATGIYPDNDTNSLQLPGYLPGGKVQTPTASQHQTRKANPEEPERIYSSRTWSHRPVLIESQDVIGASLSRPGTSSGFRPDAMVKSQPFSNVSQEARPNIGSVAPTPTVGLRRLDNEKLDKTYQSFDSRSQPQPVQADTAFGVPNSSRPSTSERRQRDAGTGLSSTLFYMSSQQPSIDPRKPEYEPTLSNLNQILEGKEQAGTNVTTAGLGASGTSGVRNEMTMVGSKGASNNFPHQGSSKVQEPMLPLQWVESSSNARNATTSRDRTGTDTQPNSKSNENSPLVKGHSASTGPLPVQYAFSSGTEDISRLPAGTQTQDPVRPRVESLRTAAVPELLSPRMNSVSIRRENDTTRFRLDGQPAAHDHVSPPQQHAKDSLQHFSHMQEGQRPKMGASSTVAFDAVEPFPIQEACAPLVARQHDNQRVRADSKPTAPKQLFFETAEQPHSSRRDDHGIRRIDNQPLDQILRDTEPHKYHGHSGPRGRSDSQHVASITKIMSTQSTEGTSQGASNIVINQEVPKSEIDRPVPGTQQVPVAALKETVTVPSRSRNPDITSAPYGDNTVQKTASSHPANDNLLGASAPSHIEATRLSISMPSSGPTDLGRPYGQSSIFASQSRTDSHLNGESSLPSTGLSHVPNPSTTEEVNSRNLPSLGFFSEAFRTELKAPREDKVTIRQSPRRDSSSIQTNSNHIAQQNGPATLALVRDPIDHARQRPVAEQMGPQALAPSGPSIVEQPMDNKEGKVDQPSGEYVSSTSRVESEANIPARRQFSSQSHINPFATDSGSHNREDTPVAKSSGHTPSFLPPQSTTQMSMAEKLFQSRQISLPGSVSMQTKPDQPAAEDLYQNKQEPTTVNASYQASGPLGPSQSQLKGGQSMAEAMFRLRQDSAMVRGPSLTQTMPVATHNSSRQDYSTHIQSQQVPTVPLSSQLKINHPALAELLSSPPAQVQPVIPRDTPANNHPREQDAKSFRIADNGIEQHGERLSDVKATSSLRPSSTVPQPQVPNKAHDLRAYNRPTNVQPLVPSSTTTTTLEAPVQRVTLPSQPPAGYPSTAKPEYASMSMSTNYLSAKSGVQAAQDVTLSHDKKTHNTSSAMPTYTSTSQPRRGQQIAPDTGALPDPMPEPNDIPSRYQGQAASFTMAQSTPAPPGGRHHHTASLPVTLGTSVQKSHQKENVPRSATPTQTHYTAASLQIPGTSAGQQASKSNVSLHRAPSEETILMTPSSLAQSLMLQPTVSRQSATPSTSSQNARKGVFNLFRRTAPPPESSQKLEFWQPGPSAHTPDSSPGHSKGRETGKGQKQSAHTPPKPVSVAPPPVQIPRKTDDSRRGFHPDVFTPFRLVASRRNRAISVASLEAQDGTAANTVVGSPTASMYSQAPIHSPPARDIREATEAWRNQEESVAKAREKENMRRRRPGVVFDVEEEHPDQVKRRPRRIKTRGRSSVKQSEDA